MNPAMVYSMSTTSMAKITPARGVLKPAAMAPATPHPTRVRMLLLGRRRRWPSTLAVAAPRWTVGPSRPTEWPQTMAAAAVTNWMTLASRGSRPW